MNKEKSKVLKYVLFPRRCVCCSDIIYPTETICDKCDIDRCRVRYPKCIYCGQENSMCGCSEEKYEYNYLLSPFYYENEIRQSIINFKFRPQIENGKFLAHEMSKTLLNDYVGDKIDIIVSVPLTRKRKRTRGFSQTDYLAEHISKYTSIPFRKGTLIKIKETLPQVGLSAKERKTNLIGAFVVDGKYDLKGKTVLLCDDNKTTGTTLNECSKTLKRAGAKSVVGLTAALTKQMLKGEEE